MRKILPADTLTPILAYMRVQGEHKVILESIPREKENARFSIVAYNPVFEVTFKDGVLYEMVRLLIKILRILGPSNSQGHQV